MWAPVWALFPRLKEYYKNRKIFYLKPFNS